MATYAHIDYTRYPLVFIVPSGDTPTLELVARFEADLDGVLAAQNGHYVTIVETENKFVSSEIRIALGKMSKRIALKYAHRTAGTILIVNNPIARLMVQGISLVSKDSWTQHVVKSRLEAERLAEQLLAKLAANQKAA